MRKSNLSSKNKHFDLANFGYGKGITILLLVLSFVLIFSNTVGSDPFYTLKENYEYFSVLEYGYCFSNFYYTEYFLILIISAILGAHSFSFLNNKQYGITMLSLPIKRKKLFNQRVILPIVGLSLIVIFTKLVMLHYNIKLFGVDSELIIQATTDILICLKLVFLGFTAFAISSVACGKKLEAMLGGASLILILPTLYNVVDSLFDTFLYGYDSISNIYIEDVNELLFILEPLHELSLSTLFYEDVILTREKLIMSALWLVVSLLALVLTKHYFVKKYKAEKIEIKAANKPMLVLISIAISMLASQLIVSFIFDWYFYLNDIPDIISATAHILIYCILMVVFAFLAMSLIETSFRLNKNKLIAVASPIVVVALVLVFTSTGGLGYEKRMPDTKDIKSIQISTTFYGSNMFNSMSSYDIYTNPDEFYLFTTENDFKAVKAIHETIIENRDSDTNEEFCVTYTLKNGDVFTRNYVCLSEEAAEKLLMLWKTDALKEEVEGYLLNNKPTNTVEVTETSSISRGDYEYYDDYDYYDDDPYSVFNYDHNVIFIASKQNTETMINDKISKAEFTRIKEAIYKDYCELTAEEWFKPTKTLGAIVLAYNGDYYYDYYDYSDEEEAKEEAVLWGGFSGINEQVTIPVTAEMKNTVAVLKSLGLYQYLTDNKAEIERVFIADAKEYFEWKQKASDEIYYYELYMPGVYFVPDLDLENDILFFGEADGSNPVKNHFGDDYYSELYDYYGDVVDELDYSDAPVEEIKNPKERVKLLTEAHIKYYDEELKGKILFVDYADGVDNAYYIPA